MNFGFLTKLIKIYKLKNNSKSKHKEQKGTFYLLEAATYYTLKATNPWCTRETQALHSSQSHHVPSNSEAYSRNTCPLTENYYPHVMNLNIDSFKNL